jgi:hypothetical protein
MMTHTVQKGGEEKGLANLRPSIHSDRPVLPPVIKLVLAALLALAVLAAWLLPRTRLAGRRVGERLFVATCWAGVLSGAAGLVVTFSGAGEAWSRVAAPRLSSIIRTAASLLFSIFHAPPTKPDLPIRRPREQQPLWHLKRCRPTNE